MTNKNEKDFKFLNDFTDWFVPTEDDYMASVYTYRHYKTLVVDEVEALRMALANRDRAGVIHHTLTLSSILHYTQLRMGLEDILHVEDRDWISYVISEVIARKMELYE